MRKSPGRPLKSREERAAEGGDIVEIYDGAPDTAEIPVDILPPAFLDPLAKDHFMDLVKLLRGMGLAKAEDVHLVTGAAMHYGVMRRTYAKLKRIEGIVQRTKTGYTQITGYLAAFGLAEKAWNAALNELGLGPQARAKLHKPGGSDSERDDFLKGKKGPGSQRRGTGA